MSDHKSIKQRLAIAKDDKTANEIIAQWVATWHREQDMITKRLGKAIANDDFDASSIAVGELKAVTSKRFQGLRSILQHLTRDDHDHHQ